MLEREGVDYCRVEPLGSADSPTYRTDEAGRSIENPRLRGLGIAPALPEQIDRQAIGYGTDGASTGSIA